MPTFDDLGDFLSPTLDLPVGGRIYKVPSPPAKDGLRLQAIFSGAYFAVSGEKPERAGATTLDDTDERDLYKVSLGPVHDEMIADGCTWEQVKHAGITAFIWHVAGASAALAYWTSPKGETVPKARKSSST